MPRCKCCANREPSVVQIPEMPSNLSNIKLWKVYWNETMESLDKLKSLKDLNQLELLLKSLKAACFASLTITSNIQNKLPDYISTHCEFPTYSGFLLKALNNACNNNSIFKNLTIYNCIHLILDIHLLLTEASTLYVRDLVEKSPETVELLTIWLTNESYQNTVNDNNQICLFLLACVSIIHNIVRHLIYSRYFDNDLLKKSIITLTNAKDECLQTSSIMALAYLVNNNEKHLLDEASKSTIVAITNKLDIAIKAKDRRCQVFGVEDIIAALSVLTTNNPTSNSFIASDGVEVLKACCNLKYPFEMGYAIKILCNLLIDSNNRKIMKEKHDIVNFLTTLKESVTNYKGELPNKVFKNIEGALWLLQGQGN